MEKTVDEIIDEYCQETNLKIGSSLSAVRRFVEWQIKKAVQQSTQADDYCHCSTVVIRDGVHCVNCRRVYKPRENNYASRTGYASDNCYKVPN